jgi:hypothetical protein
MNGPVSAKVEESSHRTILFRIINDPSQSQSLNNWNSLVLDNPLSSKLWCQLKGIIDSYYDYGNDCNRILNYQEPNYLDNSLFTFKSYLDHNWPKIALDDHCLYAHNLLLELIGYLNARLYGVIGDYYDIAKEYSTKHREYSEDWNLNQLFEYYSKSIKNRYDLTKNKYGNILEFFPFNCIRELCKPKHFLMVKKLFFMQILVHLMHRIHLRNDNQIKINIAGFDHITYHDLTPIMSTLNYNYDDEAIDCQWLEEYFSSIDLEELFTIDEFEEVLSKPFEFYFEYLKYFLEQVLPEMSNNRVILPFTKKAKASIQSLQKSRLHTYNGQKPYLLYFEKQLVFGYLLGPNLDLIQANRILNLLALPKTRGLDQVVKLLNLDQTKSNKLTKESARYLYELYQEQYNDIFPTIVEELIVEELPIVDPDIATEQAPITQIKKTPIQYIDRSLFVLRENYINYDAFRYAAVKRTFKEVERVLKIAISIHHNNDTVLDAFRAILIHPDLYGIGASLLNNKVKTFHEYTNRMRAGDLEIKLSEEFRLFLRDSDGKEQKVEIVELSNPKYHH